MSNLALILISGVVALLYWFPIRRWYRWWGTTAADLARPMSGDGEISNPTYETTLGITIAAKPEHIWPWLVQMGYRRGGLYSYDWLDRLFGFLDRPSAERIIPELQHLEAGDVIPIGGARGGSGFPVKACDRFRTLLLGGRDANVQWTWELGLYALDHQHTRLISRNRGRGPRTVGSTLFMCALEPAAFIMTRKMLLGLKRRSEALAAQQRDAARNAA